MRKSLLVMGVTLVSAATSTHAASLTLLNTSLATDVAVDEFGRTLVIAASVEGSSGQTFLYEDGFYTFIGSGYGQALSADGAVMSGTFPNGEGVAEAGRWTTITSVVGLGQLPTGLQCPSISSGYGVSADGLTLCGLAWDGCSGRAFTWTAADGMVDMDVAGSGGNRASHISRDASTLVGFGQGNFSRSPAIWNAADGTVQFFDADVTGEFWATSADNQIIVGSANGPAAIYTECSGFIEIPTLPGYNNIGQAYDVSADGTTVVGSSGTVLGGFEAFVWTVERGTESVQDVLIDAGVTIPPGVFLEIVTGVSDDGRTIVGRALNPAAEGFPYSGFIATLPDPEPCPGDLNHDGSVGFGDLTDLLAQWGPCACPGPITCPADLTVDDGVGFADLTALLNAWGPC